MTDELLLRTEMGGVSVLLAVIGGFMWFTQHRYPNMQRFALAFVALGAFGVMAADALRGDVQIAVFIAWLMVGATLLRGYAKNAS